MTTYQWLCLFGIPALIGGFVAFAVKWILKQVKGIKLGVQALLRAQMIADYNKWSEREYAPIYARQNFENCWQQYHSLGANGVMDNIHELFFQLPTEPPVQIEKKETI
ncbi:MAG: hypothetical protein J6C24_00300 [Clostridia bacterium]|nr:hypothetical protein [Clostridia bacterium]